MSNLHNANFEPYITDFHEQNAVNHLSHKWQRRSRKLQERRWKALRKHHKDDHDFKTLR